MTNPVTKKRILVVEDELAISVLYLKILLSLGFEAEVAGDGQAAKDKVGERADYSLILLDIKLPVVDGKEVYQFLAEKYPELANRVIFASGDVMKEETVRFLEQTGRPFLAKPFTPFELKTIIQQTLEKVEKAPLRKETILIVDDEAVVRRLLRQYLSGEGYRCQEAGNGQEALEKLSQQPAELVLLDIKMPGRSGSEVLPEIKKNSPDTAVIMVTAVADTATAVQCMRLGAYDYLTKPFNRDELILSASRALEKRRLELENRSYRQYLEEKVKEQTAVIRGLFLNSLKALDYALEAKDKYTSGHSQRVAKIAAVIARELGMSLDDVEKVNMAALLHDIGKIGVREAVLNKPERLVPDEEQHVRSHTEVAIRILTMVVEDERILNAVAHHHERYDGAGYPDRLKGEQIPLDARILALADAYDAMTSERPYRLPRNIEAVFAEIERCKGSQFDPKVADALLRQKTGLLKI